MTPRPAQLATLRTMRLNVTPGPTAVGNIRVASATSNIRETTLELDSHADTFVLGAGALVINNYNRPVNVISYDPAQGGTQYDTVSGVLGYRHPEGQIYHVVVHQAISIPHLDHHLACPMQARVNDVIINDLPTFLSSTPTDDSHSIVVPDPDDPRHSLALPLELKGVTSCLPVFDITEEDWNSGDFPIIELTNENLTWDPNNPTYEEQERATRDYRGKVIFRDENTPPKMVINAISSHSPTQDVADVTSDDNFADVLEYHFPKPRALAEISSNTPRLSVRSQTKHQVDAPTLAKRWGIPLDRAKRTVTKTTQRGVRRCPNPALTRRFPTNDRMLRYPRLPHPVFTDTLIAGTTSRRGNKYAQVYGTSFGWSRAYPMKNKGDSHETLSVFLKKEGVPPDLIVDGSKEQTLGVFKEKCKEADCHLKQTEPYSPWSNAAEGTIREVKRGSSRKMIRKGSPKKLWDHCLELESFIRSHTCLDHYDLDGQTPEGVMKGNTPDISHICEFGWYDWVMFRDGPNQWPEPNLVLGRYLGPTRDVGNIMTAKILKENGEVVPRSTLRHLTPEELADPIHKRLRETFDAKIELKLGPKSSPNDFEPDEMTPEWEFYADEDGNVSLPEGPSEETDPFILPTPEAGDNYVGVNISLPRGDRMAVGRVAKRKRDDDDNPVGRANANPILDTREYVVEFEDGEVTELTANVIAQSMYAECDPDGNMYVLLDNIIDYRKTDAAISLQDQKFVTNGKPALRRSTKGWQLCCEWKDGSTSWQNLSDLKESHPVHVANFAVQQGIDHEPAFNWWVPHVLKKADRIISLVRQRQARYLKKQQKFGVDLPKTVEEALALDKKNGNTLWADAIAKEMKNVKVAFDILPDGCSAPNGYQFVKCHLIFDVKMEDFRRKARLVAGGHLTEAPPTLTYASVVSRETVRIALTLAALNALEVKLGFGFPIPHSRKWVLAGCGNNPGAESYPCSRGVPAPVR